MATTGDFTLAIDTKELPCLRTERDPALLLTHLLPSQELIERHRSQDGDRHDQIVGTEARRHVTERTYQRERELGVQR